MASKYIKALKERNKARIEKATDADELAKLQEEQKEIDALEAEESKLLAAYKTALAGGPSKSNDEEDDGGGDDGSDETGGEGKKALSFAESIAKIKKKRKEE